MFRFLLILACLGGCPRNGASSRPYTAPTAETLRTFLATQDSHARSLRTSSEMEFWDKNERVKGTVLMMGRKGRVVRINGLSPAGDSVAVDIACNGQDYVLIDNTNDCGRAGVCDRDMIYQFLGVDLSSDELLLLAFGVSPLLLEGDVSVGWDEEKKAEKLVVTSGTKKQILTLKKDGVGWMLLGAQLVENEKVSWVLENKEFSRVDAPGGHPFWLPKKSRFTQPGRKSELTVRWSERELNPTLSDDKFQLSPPVNLPICGE